MGKRELAQIIGGKDILTLQIKDWVDSDDRENGTSLQTIEVHVVPVDEEEIKQNNSCYSPNIKCGRFGNYRQAFSGCK